MPFGRAIGFFTAHAYIHVGLVYQARPSHPPEESLADVTAVCVDPAKCEESCAHEYNYVVNFFTG